MSNVKNQPTPLQDPFLNTLRQQNTPVSIYLINGIKLQGQIESFDQYVILLRNTVTEMVYKHAISTVVPGNGFRFQLTGSIHAEEEAVQAAKREIDPRSEVSSAAPAVT